MTMSCELALLLGRPLRLARLRCERGSVDVVQATGMPRRISVWPVAIQTLTPLHVKRVAVANPRLVRAIAYARVKTDKVDAGTLAKLHAAGFLPEVWVADEDTYSRRHQMAERAGVLAQIIRIKRRMKNSDRLL
ncbi:hypothetical protein [Bradyrhizobium sp. CCBAU 21359]|uniref:hypothetical protein n=1 Tax=Bradyrhizobium sp. CCBAU 21359 TaxID=1325080 RepID=UPI00230587B3|nr:hypothetical protein [Bradyrhizobium sp. CCBAU 21359]